jgi:hypothetical protein
MQQQERHTNQLLLSNKNLDEGRGRIQCVDDDKGLDAAATMIREGLGKE